MLLRLLHRCCNALLIEGDGFLQNHCNGRSCLQVEVVRAEKQCERGRSSDSSADGCSNHGGFPFIRRNGQA